MANEMPLETKRGYWRLQHIFEQSKILRFGIAQPLQSNDGEYFSIELYGPSSHWELCLSRVNLDDISESDSFLEAAEALARTFESRLRTLDPYLYLTGNRRLLRIRPKWPIERFAEHASHGVVVEVLDISTRTGVRCLAISESSDEFRSNPFRRNEDLINSVRGAVDSGRLDLAVDDRVQTLLVKAGCSSPVKSTANAFVQSKVWMFGHEAEVGRAVWLPDPWDAAYFDVSAEAIIRSAAILNAQEKIQLLPDSKDFARVGARMLANEGPDISVSGGPLPQESSGKFQTALDVYTRIGVLGEGGAGRVLRVRNPEGEEFALKHLKAEAFTEQRSMRFRNEIQFCGTVPHRNILRVSDWGLATIDGIQVPFYLMPIYSQTLKDVIAAKTYSGDELLDIFDEVLNGVSMAHDIGVYHRDLKPQNILFEPASRSVVVSDFGIAHFTEPWLHRLVETGPAERLANFQYAAPEQRSKGEVDHRADIYSLGLILYEMFTGELLQGTGHTPIAATNPEFAFLDPIVNKMSAQRPEARFDSVEFVRGLIAAGRRARTRQKSSKS